MLRSNCIKSLRHSTRGPEGSKAVKRRLFSISSKCFLRLAYDLHEPTGQENDGEIGRPIIFLHGLFGSKKNNRSMSKALARDLKRPVYAIDLRNHGDSPHDSQHNYLAMSQDVEEFMAEHRLPRSTVIGHSMGAKVAMSVALHQPSLVDSLISVDNAPVDAALKSDFGKYIQGMRKIEDAFVQKQSEAENILKDFEDVCKKLYTEVSSLKSSQEVTIRQFLLTNLIKSKDESGNMYLRFRIPLQILSAALDNMADFPYKDSKDTRYSGPTLFVRGTRSHYIADNTLPAIGEFFPRFKLCDIPAGHWVISENPGAFKEAVIDFLADNT